MNPSPRYFVRVAGHVRGPFGITQLRQLAEVDVITPASEVAAGSDGPWLQAGMLGQQAEIFPPRAELGFKPTDFVVENTDQLPPLSVQELIGLAQTEGRVLRPSHPPDLAIHHAKKAAAEPNEVELMVRAVQEREALFASPLPPPPKRPMKRKLQMVLVLAVLGNLGLLAIPTVYRAWGDGPTMLLLTGWFLVLNLGLVVLYVALPED